MNHNYNRLPIICASTLVALLFFACTPQEKPHEDLLWYNHPAKSWNEALPLGNGRLGVMVFGNTTTERIQLNDDSMWPADSEEWTNTQGDKNDLKEIRELLFDGKNAEADKLFVDKFSRKSIVRSHQTLGDLFIDFDHKNISDYRRELNISNATTTVSYKSNGSLITGQVFVSHPHKAIIIELTSEAPEGINAKLYLSRPKDKGFETAKVLTTDDNLLRMQGEVTQRGGQFNSEPAPILNGVKFETCLKINNEGGLVQRGENYLEVKNATKATIYLVSNSSYYFESYHEQNKLDMEAISRKSFDVLKKEHIEDYRRLYSRSELRLSPADLDTIPTDVRLERIKSGAVDVGLEALLYQYGRYLLIASSRGGTNPANLQGLWNEYIEAPWNADYHFNINLQMNYWLADVTNLGELNKPLFDYIDRLVENGKATAAKNFGCRGTFIPHASDLWAPTWLRASTAYWGCSVGGGGWLMQHYWQHYEFTQDEVFLKERAFPAIHEVAQFYSDWIIEDPRDGTLISAPSTSPENQFLNPQGKYVATCLGSAMDQQIIYEVFDNYVKACEILKINNEFVEKVKQQKAQLRPGFVIGDDGRILEWDRAYEEMEPGHRHMSHLYGFHPGNYVSKDKNPEIFAAVKKTIDHRIANGGAGTGWSRVWLINCSARLLDGDRAHEHIQLFLQKSVSDNLFDLHPPFQIDGNFGYTAGVSEMLLQSHEENTIRLLPALPRQWENGYVKGLKARGGLTIDIFWSSNRLVKAIISSQMDKKFNLHYLDQVVPVEMKHGDNYIYQPSGKNK
ncbi:MAG: glycoside hydrolase N-terminal domain-containing protein [Bacteroidales bacterium]|jgi:alpha-L-fucosidase 2|nr:glycoside hydrolase N-terminal domain-containing protein [Bacteroidales bacterium]MDD4176933.1 glycoside hydrolase N-terminal domain-containing protein [Bacteroidales bacterium]MDD4742158.1 glycoside hydrolase N-terminal domain-containing protein [Bacteroidales bacterium]MDY0334136.1 glycoside hydrolase N-terminal domain-containing protein [Bacteroidales bacterium]NCU36265.1 glycoside hydrolase family 95 protein [Candidatus Falkowbacteria bacterium]